MRTRSAKPALCVFVMAVLVFGDAGGLNRYALLVGANNGGAGLDRLNYAEADAERFADVLRTIGEFPSSRVRVLRQPDSAGLGRELAAFKKLLSPSVSGRQASAPANPAFLLLYYSGHSDGEHLLLGKTRYPLRDIKAFLDSCGAELRVGVFDACHSGAVAAFKGGKPAEPFYFRRGESARGQVIIASSSAHQASQESEPLRGSVFTHHWLNGLRGSADVSGSRHVTLHDAYQYAYRKTVETSAMTGGGVQYPSYNFNIQGDGGIRLTNLNKSGEGFLFDRSCEGAFLVYGERGANIAADFSKSKGGEVFIAAPPGRYRVINTRMGGAMTLDAAVKPGFVERVASDRFAAPIASAAPAPRRKGAEPEIPPRRGFGYGFGMGVEASYPIENDGRLALSAAGVYNIEEDLQIFMNLRACPFGRQAAVDCGVNLIWLAEDFRACFGAGPQIIYDSRSQTGRYAIRTQTGFSVSRSKKMDISAQIPIILLLSDDNTIKSGLEAAFLFWRRKP